MRHFCSVGPFGSLRLGLGDRDGGAGGEVAGL